MLLGVCGGLGDLGDFGDFGVLGDLGVFFAGDGCCTFLGELGVAPTFGKTIAPLVADFGVFVVDFLRLGDLTAVFLAAFEPRPVLEGVFGDLRGLLVLDALRLDSDPRDVGLPRLLGDAPPLSVALERPALDPDGVTNVSRLVCEYDRFRDDFVGVGLGREARSTED